MPRALLAGLMGLALVGCGDGGGGTPPRAPSDRTIVVTETARAGWESFSDHCLGSGAASTGAQRIEAGPGAPPRGSGSYQLLVGMDGFSYEGSFNRGFDGTALAEISALRYSTYVGTSGASPDVAPLLLVWVAFEGSTDIDDVLIFEPRENGEVTAGVWQTWDARAGVWFADEGLVAWADYVAAHPGARIAEVGGLEVSVGCEGPEWVGLEGAVDAVTVGVGGRRTTYDFEL